MDKNKLIIIAAKSKLLINLTAKLCNHRWIKDDLFQEFLLRLCEKDEDVLLNKMNEGQFIWYCSNIIRRLNQKRITDKKLINTSSVLVERNDVFELNFDITDESYNFEIDMKFEKVVKFAKEQPDKANILFKSVVSTTREIASELGMNQRKLIYQNCKFKSELKSKFK